MISGLDMYGIRERHSGMGGKSGETESPSASALIPRWGKLSVTAVGGQDWEKEHKIVNGMGFTKSMHVWNWSNKCPISEERVISGNETACLFFCQKLLTLFHIRGNAVFFPTLSLENNT